MTQYRPIATINNAEYILRYFPNSTLKGDEANIIVRAYLNGDIQARKIDSWDEDSFYGMEDIVNDANFLFTNDGKYAVRFQRGNTVMLRRNQLGHGFYIDIYKVVDYAEKNIDVHGNSACDIAMFFTRALIESVEKGSSDNNNIGVMVEMPDGEVIPVSYAWYDRQREMIRISFEEEEN
jgi:hypothetical protein